MHLRHSPPLIGEGHDPRSLYKLPGETGPDCSPAEGFESTTIRVADFYPETFTSPLLSAQSLPIDQPHNLSVEINKWTKSSISEAHVLMDAMETADLMP